jgi:perosamine synthetase
MPSTPREDPPAIAGGPPAKTTPFPRPARYGAEELRELEEALAQNTLFYAQGQKVRQFEEEFAASVGASHAIACTSGTAGIHASLIAAGISPGDEVITSPITDMGTVIPILYQGGVPVFADLDPRTYCLDPASVEERLTPRTRAVVAVHLGGGACDLDALGSLCRDRGVALVEDCAQSHGCTYRGRSIGTWGEYGCFSLNEFKHISCGDGGVVVTSDAATAERVRKATDKAYSRAPDQPAAERNPRFLANNYRMTELQGAVARAQLRKLPEIVSRRRAWCGALRGRIGDLPGLLPPLETPGCDPSWWFFLMRVDPAVLGATADQFAEAVGAEGVGLGAHYIGVPVYEYPVFVEHSAFVRGSHPYGAYDYHHGLCPTAEAVLETCLILGVNEAYTEQDLEETAHALTRVVRWFGR